MEINQVSLDTWFIFDPEVKTRGKMNKEGTEISWAQTFFPLVYWDVHDAEPPLKAWSHHIGGRKLSAPSSALQQPDSLGKLSLWKSVKLQKVMDDNINPQPGGTAALVLMEAELDQLQLLQKSFPNCYCNANLCGTNHQYIVNHCHTRVQ